MVRLQSERGYYYEYDPCAPPFRDAFWLRYAGQCVSGTMPIQVYIYATIPEVSAERIIKWIKIIPMNLLNHPNIVLPIDYIEETGNASFANIKLNKRLYIIVKSLNCVSLTELVQGKTQCDNGKSIEFAVQMHELYKSDRIVFARAIAKEILNGLEHLHSKGVSIGCINPDYILFLEDNRIAINFIGAYHWYEVKQASYLQSHTHHTVVSLIGAIGPEHETMIASELLYGINDNWSDLYSMGIALFSIITGNLPPITINGETPLNEIEDKQIRKIIKKATEKDPSKRYQSAIEFINAIDIMDEDVVWYKRLYSFFGFFRKKKRLACIFISILVTFLFCTKSDAQNTMRINYKDGSISDIGYDYYLEYGFDGWTYGTFMANGMMLYLWSNGFGYRRTYRWFMTGLTENALEVMTQMGSFIYYQIQPEVYSLKVGEKSYACKDGDYYVFTDGVKVLDDEGKLKGVCEGLTYILKYNAESGLIMAYKVKVEK